MGNLLDVIETNHSALYTACGAAGYRRFFHNSKRFFGIDFSTEVIEAARKISSKPEIDSELHCTNLEAFHSDEKFDVICLGPYDHNIPYASPVIEKAREMLRKDGMIFCTCPDPQVHGLIMRAKEFLKNLFLHKNLEYHSIKKLEKILRKSNLETHVRSCIKTCLEHAFCLTVKPRIFSSNAKN